MIELSGFVPDRDIRIEFTGLRPGEKLFEELSYRGEKISATRHPKILRLECEPPPYQHVRAFLTDLAGQADCLGPDEIKGFLKRAIPEYQPEMKPSPAGVNGSAHLSKLLAAGNDQDKRNGHNGHRHPSVADIKDTFSTVPSAGDSK